MRFNWKICCGTHIANRLARTFHSRNRCIIPTSLRGGWVGVASPGRGWWADGVELKPKNGTSSHEILIWRLLPCLLPSSFKPRRLMWKRSTEQEERRRKTCSASFLRAPDGQIYNQRCPVQGFLWSHKCIKHLLKLLSVRKYSTFANLDTHYQRLCPNVDNSAAFRLLFVFWL